MSYSDRYVTPTGAGSHAGTSLANAWSWDEMAAALGASSSGLRCYIQSGTYNDSTSTLAFNASAGQPCILEGISSTAGDLMAVLSRTAAGPLDTTNFPVLNLDAGGIAAGGGAIFRCLDIRSSLANTTVCAFTTAGMFAHGCKFTFSGNNANTIGISLQSRNVLSRCDIAMTGAASLVAVTVSNTGGVLEDCRVTGNSGQGIRLTGSALGVGLTVKNCFVYASTQGISNESTSSGLGSGLDVFDTTIYGCSSDGIRLGSSANTGVKTITGCHITDNGGYAINNRGGSSSTIRLWNNRTRDNTSGATNTIGDWPTDDHITTDNGSASSDYIDASSTRDFRLIPGAVGRNTSKIFNRSLGAHNTAAQVFAVQGA